MKIRYAMCFRENNNGGSKRAYKWVCECYHSHKKRKDSPETTAAFNWILILTWNFGGDRSDSASTF